MASKKMNPATLAACRARNTITATAIGPETISAPSEIQDRRAVWLARRFGLSDMMAATVAEIAFNVGGAR